MPIFSSMARVLMRSARTMLRTAFIERSMACASECADVVIVGLAPIVQAKRTVAPAHGQVRVALPRANTRRDKLHVAGALTDGDVVRRHGARTVARRGGERDAIAARFQPREVDEHRTRRDAGLSARH